MSAFRIIRMEEVKKNNDSNSTWMVIHNSVYDVTDYLDGHPGGQDVLLEEAGKDASEAFDDVGHSSDALEIMAKYKIGELHEDDVVESEQKPQVSLTGKENKWNFWLVAIALGLTVTVVSVYKFRLTK